MKQYQKLLSIDGVKLTFEEEAISLIAKEAIKRKTGARALRSIVEELMLDIMYEVPSREDIKEFAITAEMVKKRKNVVELLPKKTEEKHEITEFYIKRGLQNPAFLGNIFPIMVLK